MENGYTQRSSGPPTLRLGVKKESGGSCSVSANKAEISGRVLIYVLN